MGKRYRIGVDVGGTHTDLVLLDVEAGAVSVEKVATTPVNPALGVMAGVEKLAAQGFDLADVEFFSHGTTITTNALLEMRGAKVGLLINKGFRAVQEIQGQARDGNPFDYFYQKPEPIAPQSRTFEIGGRIDHAGEEIEALDEAAVVRAAKTMGERGIASVAVCYLFSYMNPAHELRTRDLLKAHLPNCLVSLSSEVLPRIREWPRLSATLLNAYLAPVLVGYIGDLNRRLGAAGIVTPQRYLMQSNGGVMPFAGAVTGERTVQTLLSGPAAGAQASSHLAGRVAPGGLVTLDMGGTSADIALIEGAPLEVTEGVVARRQLDIPTLDLTTISAGGGSIVAVDRAGQLTVGPRSAGAVPGPVCYGRGGSEPTVTDADVVCGMLNPEYFLGGAQRLDFEAASRALRDRVAVPLGMTVHEAAVGIARIVDMRMADEIRVFAARRGVDLTGFTLLPFGGAGAVHAAAVARELGMRRILVPSRPGAFSALGLLCTDVIHDYVKSDLALLDRVAPEVANEIFRKLEQRAAIELEEEGLGRDRAIFARELDLRYAGQGYELRVPLDGLDTGGVTKATLEAMRDRFDETHRRIHGHAAKENAVEVVSYRLRVRVEVEKFEPRGATMEERRGPDEKAVKGKRTVHFADAGPVEAAVYDRERLAAGTHFAGPAIIEQLDATTVVPLGWAVEVDGLLNLVLTDEVTP